MSNYNLNAEVLILNNDLDAGMSGTSIEGPEGQRPASFEIHWKYPGGIINREWPVDNDILTEEKVESVMSQTGLSTDQQRLQINDMVYNYGSYIMHGDFNSFRDHYGNTAVDPTGCIVIY